MSGCPHQAQNVSKNLLIKGMRRCVEEMLKPDAIFELNVLLLGHTCRRIPTQLLQAQVC